MDSVCKLTVKSLALFLFVLVIATSCATVVTFDVEHPPLVDLSEAKTITVIPFEWDIVRENAYLASRVTAALLNGLRRGNIDTVDPYMFDHRRVSNYSQYADVYITGRIININAYDHIESKNEMIVSEADNHHTRIREVITRTAVVYIEYSYIRSIDNKTLGTFKKTETARTSFEQIRYQRQNTHQPTGRNTEHDTNRGVYHTNSNTTRRGTAGRTRGAFPQRWTWQESLVESAIARFSDTMYQELGPWSTTENRYIKRKTGNDTLAAEANNLIEQNRYVEALALYKTIYEQNGNISAGYNAAILLAANEKFSDALALLERLREQKLKEGKSVPSFIKNEIKKTTEIFNDFRALEAYKSRVAKTVSPVSVPVAASRSIAGTVNISPAMVYALTGSVSSMNDDSIFPKTVAYAEAVNGRWSMQLPATTPAVLWLLVADGPYDYYITKTAINSSGTIVLNTAEMVKLRNR